MATRQVERELAARLHQRAAQAMSRTDTLEAHRTFQSMVVDRPRKGRRRWVVPAIAAAVVALAVGVALWPSGEDKEGRNLPATEVPDTTRAANLAAAEGAVAAWVAHDTDLLVPYLEPGLSPPASSWEAELKRDAAWGMEYLMEPCQEMITNWFKCPFQVHLLGSREIGEGPFPVNEFSVNVRDGIVLSAENSKSYATNGMTQHFDSVMTWVEENHPKSAAFLLMDEEQVAPAEWPRWTRLWHQAIAEYVAATNEAG